MARWVRTIQGIPEIFEQYNGNVKEVPVVTGQVIDLLKKDRCYVADRELRAIVEEFEIFHGEEDETYFDLLMGSLYDWADAERIWIEPVPA